MRLCVIVAQGANVFLQGDVADCVGVLLPGGRVCCSTTINSAHSGVAMDAATAKWQSCKAVKLAANGGKRWRVSWASAVNNAPPAPRRTGEVGWLFAACVCVCVYVRAFVHLRAVCWCRPAHGCVTQNVSICV